MNHPPLEIMFWLSDYLQTAYKQEYIQSIIDLKNQKSFEIGNSLNARKSYSLLKIDDLQRDTEPD